MTVDDVKRILVVGAGQMGAQIAMQSALHGYECTLTDLSVELCQKGMAGNRKQLERRVQKGQMWSWGSTTLSARSGSATSRGSTSATTPVSRCST